MKNIKKVIESLDEKGRPVLFSCKVFTRQGKLLNLKDVRCTSSYHGGTYNVILPNNQVRKIRELFMIEVNGKEVMA